MNFLFSFFRSIISTSGSDLLSILSFRVSNWYLPIPALRKDSTCGVALPSTTTIFSNLPRVTATSRALYRGMRSCSLYEWSCSSSTIIIFKSLIGTKIVERGPIITLYSPCLIAYHNLIRSLSDSDECIVTTSLLNLFWNLLKTRGVIDISGTKINALPPFFITSSTHLRYTSVLPLPVIPYRRKVSKLFVFKAPKILFIALLWG